MADQHVRLLSRRFQIPVAKTNLIEVDDYPEPPEEATPRSFGPSSLWVENVDMLMAVNTMEHQTSRYKIKKLVVRRGQAFRMLVSFSQDVNSKDVHLEFLIGSNPNQMDQTRVMVPFGWNSHSKSSWTGQATQQRGSHLELLVRPDPRAIVGKYRCYVVVNDGGRTVRSRRNDTTDLYVLFNPWCPEDCAYYPREWQQDLQEYILNDSGMLFQGTVTSILHHNWIYGQFDIGILDACIYILDAAHMPIKNRSDLTAVIRKASAVLNAQDDNGVMVGNWSTDYSNGTAPTTWSGSVEILRSYASSGNPVRFAQCWVYAGVFTTFLRCLGIASRPITNFNSAHDNTGNLRVDLLYRDNVPDNANTLDSIWNYHCWNEVYMKRVDLPPAFSGWQAVDATPQETSEGLYRCGPASLTAIKTGQICFGYDTGFILAEVNSDVVYHNHEDGEYKVFKVDKTHVGKLICTKAVGSHDLMDITDTYKYREGTEENQNSLDYAEGFGMMRDHTVIEEEEPLRVTVNVNEVYRGQDIEMMVNIRNLTRSDRQFHGHLDVATEYYTGISDKPFYRQDIHTEVKVNDAWQYLYMLNFNEFRQHIIGVHTLQVSVTGEVDSRLVTEIKLIELKLHAPTVVVSGDRHVNGLVTVTVTYKNDSGDILTDVDLAVSGTDMDHAVIRHHDTVDTDALISEMIQVRPTKVGHYTFIGKVILQQVYEASGAEEFDIDS